MPRTKLVTGCAAHSLNSVSSASSPKRWISAWLMSYTTMSKGIWSLLISCGVQHYVDQAKWRIEQVVDVASA